MASIFRDMISKFIHIYLDDIFVFSDTIEDHGKFLKVVFNRLQENHLYLKWKKCNLYADKIECLGQDDHGSHLDTNKMEQIRNWRTPQNYLDIQRFVGLVNYISNFLPKVTSYTRPLMSMTQNRAPFFWRPIHKKCFEIIKAICCKTPIIKPINYELNKPIWLICNASKMGVGAMYGQGKDWTTCQPAGFMLKKFS
jgi:hypothetical protein